VSMIRADAGPSAKTGLVTSFAITRRAVLIWPAAICFFHQILDALKGRVTTSVAGTASDLAAVGVFQYMAWYAVFRLLLCDGHSPSARRQEVAVSVGLSLLLFMPARAATWVAASGLAVYLWTLPGNDKKLRSAGAVLAALSVQELWGQLVFQLFGHFLLLAETAVIGTILVATRAGMVWHQNIIAEPGGHAIIVLAGCSSFHNISIALLCWVTISRLRNPDWRIRDVVGAGIVASAIITLNSIRLYLMALDEASYRFWHNGTGSEVFNLSVSLTVLLMCLIGLRTAESQA
jgi:hypothetical protein